MRKGAAGSLLRMTELFGGAVLCSGIPSSWRDVSQIRQCPDHQEVFQGCVEETGGVLLVFEVLQHQERVEDESAGAFFLSDLADSNRAEESSVVSGRVIKSLDDAVDVKDALPSLRIPDGFSGVACISRGRQKVAQGKDGRNEARWIDIHMCVLRLRCVETDFVISLSVPLGEESSAAQDSHEIFSEILRGFKIIDWNLFG